MIVRVHKCSGSLQSDCIDHPRVRDGIEKSRKILLLKVQIDLNRNLFKLTLYFGNDGLNCAIKLKFTKNGSA